ncbi:DNA methyltransferase [Arthrobacter sp. StoSoilB22]|uniref:DNA-methyltransferase n=1 Tax=Arthrobacter sp. StoSoilB22 TaxID=2830996 RepID=UPI001CC6C8ED|nr:DNA methyltransferase [Arthrobacter sp. StoSoilB22]BCW61886.1 restriction endonuclease subunit M [Arthrobacter sp. StoSoilB22]
MSNMDAYITDEADGENWKFLLGDSAERIDEIEPNSVHLSIYSPPFQSLYTYSPSVRDMGNSLDREDFFDQYDYIIRGNLRITVPGGLACVHVAQTSTTKATHGVIGLNDFRGDVIRAYQAAGWIYFGEVTVDKDPQAQAIRTKATSLTFATKNRDSSSSRPALADYLLIFKKPGDRAEKVKTDCTNDEWIQWARPIWYGIQETNTLNARIARETDDERHLTPLQLDFIERCVRLYTNPGDTVFTAFGGVSSELYMAVKLGRKAIGIELKPSYWATGVGYLQELEEQMSAPSLLDGLGAP